MRRKCSKIATWARKEFWQLIGRPAAFARMPAAQVQNTIRVIFQPALTPSIVSQCVVHEW
jgi:hypothetical protein